MDRNATPKATKEEIIQKLGLAPLQGEGGLYKETYRSKIMLDAHALGIAKSGQRHAGTAIYYMVTENDFSALHRLKGDEVFHFYAGDAVEMVQIAQDGSLKRIVLGSDILADQTFQAIAPSGVWQGTRLAKGGKWALLGTTMSPGFDFADFELGKRKHLIEQFPTHAEAIKRFTREE
jgi:predicted cupin superfamily sugar epimerase